MSIRVRKEGALPAPVEGGKALSWFHRLFPYGVILLCSLIALWVWVLFPWITDGDDGTVQLAMAYDVYYGLQHGFLFSTNHVYMGNYAMNMGLFYGLLFQYLAAILAYLFEWAGATLIGSIKTVAVLSLFVSGAFAYLLAYKATGRRSLALALGIFYVFMPYRLFCFLYRFSLSEAFALMFPPLAFYGAYRIFTDESPRIAPYSILALSIAGTALSHPYTAFLEVLALLLMAAFRFKDCLRLVKEKGFWVRILPAAALALFLVLPFLVPMASALSSEAYLVSDEEVMWTEAGHLVGTVPMSMQYAGFLNFPWRDQYQPGGAGDTFLSWTLGLVLYPVAIGLSYALDLFLRKRSGLEGWTLFLTRALALLLFTLGVPLLMGARLELFLAFLLYFLCYLVMVMLPPGEEERERLSLLSRGLCEERLDFRALLKEGELFSGILTMGLALIALFLPYFWRIAPSFLRLCQFPFRWWGFFWMGFLLFLLPLLRLGRGREESAPIALGLSIFFLVLQMATVDKRIWAVEKGNGHNVEPTVSSVSEIDHFGHQNEYFPRIIYDIFDGKAESDYPDSLVHTLGKDIVEHEEPPFGIEEYVSPVFLEGDGDIEILSLNTPEADFSLIARSGSLVQFPQIYYDGYEGTLLGKDGERVSAAVSSVDGFLALEVPEGEWTLELRYPGPLARRILEPFAWCSLALLLLGTPLWTCFESKKKGAPEGSPQEE